MASAAAGISTTLLRPPRVLPGPSPVASGYPLPMPTMLRRRHRSMTITCAAVQKLEQQAVVREAGTKQPFWTSVPISAIGPATADQSIFLITLDLSGAPNLVDAYTTPGQYILTRVPSQEKHHGPACMCISSAPCSGLHFDLLVRSVPGTTSEELCKLSVGDVVDIGPVMGRGFAIQKINPPSAAENVLLFAVGEGISPVRSLIEFGFSAEQRNDVRLFYVAKNLQSMPYQERFGTWEKTGVKVVPLTETRKQTGVKVVPLTEQIDEHSLERNLNEIIVNPHSTGAVIVGPRLLKEVITGVLTDYGVPNEKILTIEWNPDLNDSNA